MTHKERHDQLNKVMPDNLKRTPEQVIENIVNQLIDALYIPVKGAIGITHCDDSRLKLFGIEDEPINWGDLKCIGVEAKKVCHVCGGEGEHTTDCGATIGGFSTDGSYLVTIDEAAPEDCPTFCRYIEEYMLSYGWSVVVITEW